MLRAVIFDFDGVLIDSEGLQYKAYSEVLAGFGVEVSVEEYARHWIAAGRGPEYAVEKYQLKIEPNDLRQLKHPVYHQILRREVTLMPFVKETLGELSGTHPLAIATNSNLQDVSFVIEDFDLGDFFRVVTTREDYARAKPCPDAFLAAAESLGFPPSECLVIEDAHKGVLAAQAAGIPVIAVPNQYTADNDFSAGALMVLQDLSKLNCALLAEL